MAHRPLTREELARRIGETMARDRRRLRRRLARLHDGDAAGHRRLEAAVARSAALRARRAACLPAPEFPPELPIVAARARIEAAIERHRVIVVAGETGSGKTTQLPKICLAAGRGAAGFIGHTQPRRIAARSVAARIARELGTRVGEVVGCKVRFHDETRAAACIKVMTDGILVAEIGRDRDLEAYDTLIIDEAHERSLNIDLLLGHVKRVLPRRPDLRVIVSSATLDPERIAGYFGDAPVIDVSGRVYPVEVRYVEEEAGAGADPVAAAPDAVRALAREGPGDILVFLPGERDIREMAKALAPDQAAFEVLPLYARLNNAQQERIFRPGSRRRVVLATNVAETSITVPGIRFVVDTGLARVSRYHFRTKVQRLPVEPISRASADQRKGRCGRLGPGVCLRLYSREDFARRRAFTDPEIRRTNLASIILRMAVSGLGRIDEFAFIDPPDRRFVSDGYRLLRELGALAENDRVTGLGRRLARLPLDPRFGRMLLAAGEHDCVAEILVIASVLSVGDPREWPAEGGRARAAAHRRHADPRSDFLGLLNLWHALQAERPRWRGSEWRRYCEEHHLSPRRTREWLEVHRQLLALTRELGLRHRPEPATYAQIHRAILAGLVAHIGVRAKGREYRGLRDRMFVLSPGSAVKPSGQQWIMAAELVETSVVYAYTAARIRPQWIERAARDLLAREYFEPRFDPDRGEVMAQERIVLFGLTLVPRRRVRFAPVDPAAARDLFIAEGLVGERLVIDAPFVHENRAAIERVRTLERKARRTDLLADEEARAGFFRERLPLEVATERAFRRWLDTLDDDRRLCYRQWDLVRARVELPDEEAYPDSLEILGIPVGLAYVHAPGRPDDGVTARIGLAALGGSDAAPFEWLVPGRREEKAVALLRTLPRPLRRRIVPISDTARRCLRACDPRDGSFAEALRAALLQVAGIEVTPGELRPDLLPEHLHMRFEVVDSNGRIAGSGRDLAALKERFAEDAARAFARAAEQTFERDGLTGWTFEDLPAHIDAEHAGDRFRGYPALEDRGDRVALRLFEEPGRAAAVHPRGLHRLAMLSLGRELRAVRRDLGRMERLGLRYLTVPASPWSEPDSPVRAEGIEAELLERTVEECCLAAEGDVRTRAVFERRLREGRSGLARMAAELRDLAQRILSEWEAVRRVRSALDARAWPESIADADDQLAFLVYRGFIAETARRELESIPRYLEALRMRLEKLPRNPARDLRALRSVRPLWEPMREELRRIRQAGRPLGSHWAECRWMIEELRVSLFAQELGTRYPVSESRLARVWAERPIPIRPPRSIRGDPGRDAPRCLRAPDPGTDSGSSPADRAPG